MKLAYLIIILFTGSQAFSQVCPNPGQNPATAFPVCGTSVFTQNTVPLCSGTLLPSPRCTGAGIKDVNPYWYKFTCFQAGTLGFLITPKDLSDDYDWEVYDVTGKNPNDIYTDGSLVISSNWSGESGLTGASAAGRNLYVCEGDGQPLFSKMGSLILGHDYLLLISHFTQTQSGYDLQFKDGTAVITDPQPPALKKAVANCGGDKLRVILSKKMKCSSIAADGSDFLILPAGISIVSATGISCNSRFDTDSVDLILSGPLSPGSYTLNMKNGIDGNTIIDNCNVGIPVSDKYGFIIPLKLPTPMDSMAPLKCAPSEIKLVFNRRIQCSSISADGSDFAVTGSYPVNVISAAGICINGLADEIIVKLDKPLMLAGSFKITLQKGLDGGTITDECNESTPDGSSINFMVKDTVNADFNYQLYYGCKEDTVDYMHDGRNGVNIWQWSLGDDIIASAQNPQAIYKVFKNKSVQLIVSNGFCSDTSSRTITIDNYLKADFMVDEDNCPMEPIVFSNNSEGKIIRDAWSFDDGDSSFIHSPDHRFNRPVGTSTYKITYTATDIWGCISTATRSIRVYPSCIIDVPNTFTPNGDNINDFFYPLNAIKAMQLDFKVYNRWGQMLYSTSNWKKGWNGKYKDLLQPSGMYAWTLRYIDRDTKKLIQRKGMVFLAN